MAPISDLSLTLVDGGLEFSTTDTNFQGGGVKADITLESSNGNTYMIASGLEFDAGGIGSIQWSDFGFTNVNQPSLPLNITFAVNDDDDPAVWSANDSVFYYNITSTSNDLFDSTNVLSQGRFIDTTATVSAILTFSSSSTIEYDVSGDNYLRLIGTIENYDSLVAEYGELIGFRDIEFRVQDNISGTDNLYVNYTEYDLNDIDTVDNTFDVSIKIPNYIPNGTIVERDFWGALSFQNDSFL